MASTILVTGGTGTLGRLVVPRLRAAGREIRVLSRTAHEAADGVEYVTGDLGTAEGVDAAVAGVPVILHLAGGGKGDDEKARNLVKAAAKAGTAHLLYISVVGAERIPVVSGIDRTMFGYFAAKRAAELIVAESGIPFTTLRATQFHDLTLTAVQAVAKLPIAPSPSGFQFQPIETDEVAARLVELTLGEPAGLVPDMGGPRAYPMADLIRSYLRATHKRRLLLPMRMPGKAAAAFRAGGNLTLDHAVGHRTWEEFLAERVGASRA